jgi:hypothetical protein
VGSAIGDTLKRILAKDKIRACAYVVSRIQGQQ